MARIAFPARIAAGTTLDFTIAAGANPSPVWQAAASLRGAATAQIVATPDGIGGHRFTVPSTVTAAWAAGKCWWAIRASSNGIITEMANGSLIVAIDYAQAAVNYDGRTHAERTLSAIEAVIENRASLDQERYRINNRELHRTPMAELLRMRGLYKAEVRREKLTKSGNLFNQSVKVRFRNGSM